MVPHLLEAKVGEPIQLPYNDSPNSNIECSVLEAIHCQFKGLARWKGKTQQRLLP